MTTQRWQLDMGARVIDGDRVRFRVPAPKARLVEVETYPPGEGIVRYPMECSDGLWSATIEAPAGTLYRYRLDGDWGYPDPHSRSQPEGVHGPSQVVNPAAFRWTDGGWRGLDPEALVIYECHVGTYTPAGTFDALIDQLDALRSLGVTALELMPVAEFPGRRNWGYDGAHLFAPSSVYGGPEALRRLVDAAHAKELGVILDVVYNHLGPDGSYAPIFLTDYFTDRYQTPWGDAVNYDGSGSDSIRRYVIDNALYWLHEFHIDGFRLDATEQIYDQSDKHILQELAQAVRERGPAERRALVIAEHERTELRLIRPVEAGGYGLDAIWADDFHHSLHVLLTGERQGYLSPFDGATEELAQILQSGLRHASADAPAQQLVYCLKNHDQVGNRPLGERLPHLVGLERYKATCALLLLAPCTPLLFMGDEFAASTPFQFFTDHQGDLGEQVAAGRREEFKDLWSSHDPGPHEIPDPQADETFIRSRLDLSERERPPHNGVYRLCQALLRLRREDPVLRNQARQRMRAQAPTATLIAVQRWDDDGHHRLVLVNLGDAARFDASELGQEAALPWRPLLATAEQRFAGPGVDLAAMAMQPGAAIELPPRCAILWEATDV